MTAVECRTGTSKGSMLLRAVFDKGRWRLSRYLHDTDQDTMPTRACSRAPIADAANIGGKRGESQCWLGSGISVHMFYDIMRNRQMTYHSYSALGLSAVSSGARPSQSFVYPIPARLFKETSCRDAATNICGINLQGHHLIFQLLFRQIAPKSTFLVSI